MVAQPHVQLPAVVAVDDAHPVGDGNPMLDPQAAAGEDEPHMALGNLRGQARGKQGAVPRLQHHRLLDAGAQVKARAARRLPLGELRPRPHFFHPQHHVSFHVPLLPLS